jgi:hypothetical protein
MVAGMLIVIPTVVTGLGAWVWDEVKELRERRQLDDELQMRDFESRQKLLTTFADQMPKALLLRKNLMELTFWLDAGGGADRRHDSGRSHAEMWQYREQMELLWLEPGRVHPSGLFAEVKARFAQDTADPVWRLADGMERIYGLSNEVEYKTLELFRILEQSMAIARSSETLRPRTFDEVLAKLKSLDAELRAATDAAAIQNCAKECSRQLERALDIYYERLVEEMGQRLLYSSVKRRLPEKS